MAIVVEDRVMEIAEAHKVSVMAKAEVGNKMAKQEEVGITTIVLVDSMPGHTDPHPKMHTRILSPHLTKIKEMVDLSVKTNRIKEMANTQMEPIHKRNGRII